MLRTRKYATMGSWERPFISRAPPTSRFTKKKEWVDPGRVVIDAHDDSSRFDENIGLYSRGNNPMGGNYNIGNTSLAQRTDGGGTFYSATPYKLGVVRPPIYTQQDLMPLSRMKYQTPSGTTNMGSSLSGNVGGSASETVDYGQVKSTVLDITSIASGIRPTYQFTIQRPQEGSSSFAISNKPRPEYNINKLSTSGINSENKDVVFRQAPDYNSILEKAFSVGEHFAPTALPGAFSGGHEKFEGCKDPMNIPVYTRLLDLNNNIDRLADSAPSSNIREEVLKIRNVRPNISIIIYDPNNKNYTEVKGSVKDKMNIIVQTAKKGPLSLNRDNGEPIKLRDYTFQVINSAVGTNQIIINSQKQELNLDRNMPVYASMSVAGALYNKDSDVKPIVVPGINDERKHYEINPTVRYNYELVGDHKEPRLPDKLTVVGSLSDYTSRPQYTGDRALPTLSGTAMEIKKYVSEQLTGRNIGRERYVS